MLCFTQYTFRYWTAISSLVTPRASSPSSCVFSPAQRPPPSMTTAGSRLRSGSRRVLALARAMGWGACLHTCRLLGSGSCSSSSTRLAGDWAIARAGVAWSLVGERISPSLSSSSSSLLFSPLSIPFPLSLSLPSSYSPFPPSSLPLLLLSLLLFSFLFSLLSSSPLSLPFPLSFSPFLSLLLSSLPLLFFSPSYFPPPSISTTTQK